MADRGQVLQMTNSFDHPADAPRIQREVPVTPVYL